MGTAAYRLQDSFNGGEVSRRLQSRPTLAIYNIAAAEVRNMAASVEGAIVKTPGTWYRAAALPSCAATASSIPLAVPTRIGTCETLSVGVTVCPA